MKLIVVISSLLLFTLFESLRAKHIVDDLVKGCPSLNHSDFSNVTDISEIPNCFCDRTDRDDGRVKISCLYTSTVVDLSSALNRTASSKRSVDEIFLSNMIFDRQGIPDDFFLNHNSTPSSLTVSNCLGADKRLYFTNNSFRGLEKSLKKLDIESCVLMSVPNTIGDLENLESLSLKETVIYYLHETNFRHLKNLRFMDLSTNYMYYVEPGTFVPLQKLETLILGPDNGFNSSVFPEINKLPNLSTLDLSGNGVHSFPNNAFASMKNLSNLNLARNFIDILRSDAFRGLKNLRRLDLSENLVNFTEYNAFHPDLENLEYLNLFGNYMPDVEPETFINLRNLRTLDLSWNNFYYLTDNTFETLTKLKSLNLTGNRNLMSLDGDAFAGLPSLTVLNVSMTGLNYTDGVMNPNLLNVTVLDFGRTALSSLDRRSLSQLKNLRTLILNDTKIKTFERGTFDDLKFLRQLDVSGNHFACDQDLVWFMAWMQREQNYSSVGDDGVHFMNAEWTKCWTPLELRDVPLTGVDLQTMKPQSQITFAAPSGGVSNSNDSSFVWPWTDATSNGDTTTVVYIDVGSNKLLTKLDQSSHAPDTSGETAKIIIIVVVVGGILVTAAIVTVVVVIMRRRRHKDEALEKTGEPTISRGIELEQRFKANEVEIKKQMAEHRDSHPSVYQNGNTPAENFDDVQL